MKTSFIATVVLSVATLAGSQAMAMSSAHITRDQVRAELAEAVRTGDIVGWDEQGRQLNEIYPNQYPAKVAAQGKTRAQVQAELAEAIRAGDIQGWDRQGRMLNEIYPDRYSAKPVATVNAQNTTTAANDVLDDATTNFNGESHFLNGH